MYRFVDTVFGAFVVLGPNILCTFYFLQDFSTRITVYIEDIVRLINPLPHKAAFCCTKNR